MDLFSTHNPVLMATSLAAEVAFAANILQRLLDSPMPRYFTLTRDPTTNFVSARQLQTSCSQLVQIGLYLRNARTPDQINPTRFQGMRAWDDLSEETQKLIMVARQKAGHGGLNTAHLTFLFSNEQEQMRESLKDALEAITTIQNPLG